MEATLFVWSKREVTPADIGARGRHRLEGGYGPDAGEPEYEARLVLPENQGAVVEPVQLLARVRAGAVKLVDLGRARHFIERRRAEEMSWTDFPVLVSANGMTLSGSAAFSEETIIKALTGGMDAPR